MGSIGLFMYLLFLKITTYSIQRDLGPIDFLAPSLVIFVSCVLAGHTVSWTRPFLPRSEWLTLPKK
ncbi:MAG: hypothetical protein COU47_01875 [Candidatus Niyogibacteria bacterium CG10_big_fil_rev_8_21_14_0_10_46_36]|uniref:ABC transporter permease n=1 Tax=Candidatus Niyogibacteria bacterium CG10_big_fil_rev_8_21_14_0_10_46_36 TaxID=1974726 RepID=A0A2H0TDL0_9BACT|nr:MAG: hypothetical protein COU47_01875 [Candidatus Niyogibacteria bacterium CG10_big_fil_rev_8_21_14_0_10_46_36]